VIPLTQLSLQHFRTHAQLSLNFDNQVTVISGPNASGKTSILEAINLLATGDSFRAKKISEMISFDADLGRVRGMVSENEGEPLDIEILLTHGVLQGKRAPHRLFRVNDVARQKRIATHRFFTTAFRPEDLRLVEGSPSRRRGFLDTVLSSVHPEYERSLRVYDQTLRRRNKLLEQVRSGEQSANVLSYWDVNMLKHGTVLQKFRTEFAAACAGVAFPKQFTIEYLPSIISEERQDEYRSRAIAAGHSLIGPHKDDFAIHLQTKTNQFELSAFGSRGQQRLAVLWLKLCEHAYVRENSDREQILLLDDIWSELDDESQAIIEPLFRLQQTIITTTSEELAEKLTAAHVALGVE